SNRACDWSAMLLRQSRAMGESTRRGERAAPDRSRPMKISKSSSHFAIRLVAAFGAGCASAGVAAQPPVPASVSDPDASDAITVAHLQAAERIDGERIRRVVAEIASDAYAGRAPGT